MYSFENVTKAVCHGHNTMSHIMNVAATFIVRLPKEAIKEASGAGEETFSSWVCLN